MTDSWEKALQETWRAFNTDLTRQQQELRLLHREHARLTDAQNLSEGAEIRQQLLTALQAVTPGMSLGGSALWERAAAGWEEPAWSDCSRADSGEPSGGLVRIGSFYLDEPPRTLAVVHQTPALIPLIGERNLLIEASGAELERANSALVSTTFRLLTSVQPGKVRFIGIDPVGLGQSFSALLSLDEAIRGPKIYHEHREIEDALEEMTNHMSMVIQKYLRDEYASIDDYNRDAGVVAEPYRLILVANFPAGFRPETAARLLSIAANGPRVGVHVLLSRDTTQTVPREFSLNELHRLSTTIRFQGSGCSWQGDGMPPNELVLDDTPPRPTVEAIIAGLNTDAGDFDRIEVPFDDFCPEKPWEGSAISGIGVPVGRRGARDSQVVRFGEGTEHHALVGGRTGSGKTVLLHALICNLALHYSPEEVEFYLIDFKEGVEFSIYRELPHARVVAIEAEREFGLSVIEGLREELGRRGDAWRGVASNLTEWREKTGERVPRILLVIDEFQMFFLYNDRIAGKARTALDDIARRGRSFGIHLVLASQTLGSMDIDPSTLSNISVRIALQMSESDSQKILGRENEDARLLTRPGEAIFNPQGGLSTHNVKFQVAYLPSSELAGHVDSLRKRANETGFKRYPVVFEGNRLANMADNAALSEGLSKPAEKQSRWCDLYLGEPTVLQEGHACYRLRRQSQGNLLMVGPREEVAFTMFAAILASIASQVPPQTGQVLFSNLAAVDSPIYEAFDPFFDLPIPFVMGEAADVDSHVARAHEELQKRQSASEERAGSRRSREVLPPWFLCIFGLQRARSLRKAGLSGPPAANQLKALLKDGPAQGIHVLVWADTPSTLSSIFSSTEVAEFGGRVALTGGDVVRVLTSTLQQSVTLKPNYALLADTTEPDVLQKIRCYGPELMPWLATTMGWEVSR